VRLDRRHLIRQAGRGEDAAAEAIADLQKAPRGQPAAASGQCQREAVQASAAEPVLDIAPKPVGDRCRQKGVVQPELDRHRLVRADRVDGPAAHTTGIDLLDLGGSSAAVGILGQSLQRAPLKRGPGPLAQAGRGLKGGIIEHAVIQRRPGLDGPHRCTGVVLQGDRVRDPVAQRRAGGLVKVAAARRRVASDLAPHGLGELRAIEKGRQDEGKRSPQQGLEDMVTLRIAAQNELIGAVDGLAVAARVVGPGMLMVGKVHV